MKQTLAGVNANNERERGAPIMKSIYPNIKAGGQL